MLWQTQLTQPYIKRKQFGPGNNDIFTELAAALLLQVMGRILAFFVLF